MAADHIAGHVASLGFEPTGIRRYWLHQANLAMNQLIGKRLLGHEASADEAPVILDEFANTASAGSIIAFHRHHADPQGRRCRGDLLLWCRLFDRQRGRQEDLITASGRRWVGSDQRRLQRQQQREVDALPGAVCRSMLPPSAPVTRLCTM